MIPKPDYIQLKAKVLAKGQPAIVEDFTAFKMSKGIMLQDVMVRFRDNTMRKIQAEEITPR